ncbi:MAG: flagellar biosynthetic protein FliO [Myxococcota bacterium]
MTRHLMTAIAVAASVGALTVVSPATAQLLDPPPTLDTPSPAPAAEPQPTNTRLNLRPPPEGPLGIASGSATSGGSEWWWKVLAVLGVGGAGALLILRRKQRAGREEPKRPEVEIISRTTLGARNELCVVSVDGQRLLLGVSPQGVQRLAALDEAAPAEAMPRDAIEPRDFEAGFDQLLKKLGRQPDPEPLREVVVDPEALELEIAGPAAAFELEAPPTPRTAYARTAAMAPMNTVPRRSFRHIEIDEEPEERRQPPPSHAQPSVSRRGRHAEPSVPARTGQAATLAALVARHKRAS